MGLESRRPDVDGVGEAVEEIVRRTGCQLLLDVNNVLVCATNHDFDPEAFIDAFPVQHVREIHLGGHAEDADDAGRKLLVDEHGCSVADPVLELYARAIGRAGPIPTLIEWDNNIPSWTELMLEAWAADEVMASIRNGSRKAA